MHTCERKRTVGAVDYGIGHRRRVSHPLAAIIYLVVAAVLLSPIDYGIARKGEMGFCVLAAPCVPDNATAREAGATTLEVNATTDLNLTSIFACEGGTFEVAWSGTVNVSGTIHIGLGTTVTIVGDRWPNSTGDTASSTRSINITASSGNSSIRDEVDTLTAALSIPHGLTSAAVRVGYSETSVEPDRNLDFGPIFLVDGGQLILVNMAVRGGCVNSADNPIDSGAAIHAQHSNITATGCEFEDNFAPVFGGGIFGNYSSLVVVDSVFRRCRAGFEAEAGDEDEDVVGKGGGIGVRMECALPTFATVSDIYARICSVRFRCRLGKHGSKRFTHSELQCYTKWFAPAEFGSCAKTLLSTWNRERHSKICSVCSSAFRPYILSEPPTEKNCLTSIVPLDDNALRVGFRRSITSSERLFP